MADDNDPRMFFAAEQALLAWIRTGLAVMGFGFVVSRFGLFLRFMSQTAHGPVHLLVSTTVGVALVFLGVVAVVMAGLQHLRFCRTLNPRDLPAKYAVNLGVWFAFALATIGIVMAVYLIVWTEEV